MTTQSKFRLFRSDQETLVSEPNPVDETVRIGTGRAEVPASVPATESKFRSFIIPPDLLTNPRPAWTEMRDYAHHAPWIFGGHRWMREAGVWYWRLVALPMALVARTVEWVFERPGRALLVGGLIWWGISLLTK